MANKASNKVLNKALNKLVDLRSEDTDLEQYYSKLVAAYQEWADAASYVATATAMRGNDYRPIRKVEKQQWQLKQNRETIAKCTATFLSYYQPTTDLMSSLDEERVWRLRYFVSEGAWSLWYRGDRIEKWEAYGMYIVTVNSAEHVSLPLGLLMAAKARSTAKGEKKRSEERKDSFRRMNLRSIYTEFDEAS